MPSDLAEAAHRNLLAYHERSAQWFPGGRVERRAGCLLLSTDLTFPGLNVAIRADPAADATAMLDEADRAFGGRPGFVVNTRDPGDDDLAEAALAAGAFEYGDGAPEMVCVHRLEDRPPPEGATLRRVDDAAGVATYAAVAGAAFGTLGWPADQMTASFANVSALLRDDVFMFLGIVDGSAVAAAMSVVFPGGGAYISWVATLAAARGRGLGEAVTRAATNAGFDAGAAFASLEASHMGAPIYARMGYDTLYRYRHLVRTSS